MKLNLPKNKKRIGVRTQIFIGFGVFTALIIALIWIFQISLLNTFYKFIKQSEIKSTASYIEANIDSDDLTEVLRDVVILRDIDVLITDDEGKYITSLAGFNNSLFETITTSQAIEMYVQTKASGGEYLETYPVFDFTRLAFDIVDYGREESKGESKSEGVMFLKTIDTQNGENLLLFLNTVVTPVDSTVETLKIQLWCLSAVMIIVGFLLVLLISNRISKPLSRINSTAKELSKGNYDIQFDSAGGGKEIKELSHTLDVAAKELSKVENLRKDLIANVSHDLRTPLTMISGYAEVMRDIPGENTPENVQIIIDEAKRLENLVNDLLDISKLESGNQEIKMEQVNITSSIKNILLRYDKLVDFSFDFYHGEDVFVLGDELKLSQVIYNLVNNAVTYTGEDKRVVLTQSVKDGYVKIEVKDSGIGIPEDKIKDIWQRYYKVEKEHKRARIGTGLGLSIVSQVLELHGGSYGVISEENKGSCFWFSLKIYDSDQSEAL